MQPVQPTVLKSHLISRKWHGGSSIIMWDALLHQGEKNSTELMGRWLKLIKGQSWRILEDSVKPETETVVHLPTGKLH